MFGNYNEFCEGGKPFGGKCLKCGRTNPPFVHYKMNLNHLLYAIALEGAFQGQTQSGITMTREDFIRLQMESWHRDHRLIRRLGV